MIINKLTYISIKTMNQDLLRVFETESDYDSAKTDFVYPTVSYVRDIDNVRYMSKPLLPIIDTTGYATEFVVGEYYPQEALVFKAIYDMYQSQIPEGGLNCICIYEGELYVLDGNYEKIPIAFVGNEPLYENYLINFETENNTDTFGDINMQYNEVLFTRRSNDYLNYSDGLCSAQGPM